MKPQQADGELQRVKKRETAREGKDDILFLPLDIQITPSTRNRHGVDIPESHRGLARASPVSRCDVGEIS